MLAAAPVMAAGPIDGEVSAVWWANDYQSETQASTASEDAGSAGLRAQLWMMERYGVRATQYASDPDSSNGADYTSVDLMWRALAPTENNFFAVGLGWQQMEVAGLTDDPSGLRVAVEGRIGLAGMVYAYGHGAYLPSLGDADASNPLDPTFRDLNAYEYELGVAWNAMPFMNVHAGYRSTSLSYEQDDVAVSGTPGGVTVEGSAAGGTTSVTPGGNGCSGCTGDAVLSGPTGETESSGFFVGLGFQF
jgi:hypothetical protein